MTMATISAMAMTMTGCFGPETSKEYVTLNDYMMLHYTDVAVTSFPSSSV